MRRTLLAACALLLGACFSGYSERPEERKDLRVRKQAFANDVVLTGELESARGDIISVPPLPSWQTSIKWIALDGAEVKAGEKVVELDNSAFATDLDAKRQTLTQTMQELQQRESEWKADLEDKQLEAEKKRTDFEKAKLEANVPRDVLSARDYENRQTELRRASVAYEKAADLFVSRRVAIASERSNLDLRRQKAERDISRAEAAIDSLVLRAPRGGIMVIKDIPWEGRKLQAGDTVWVGFPLAIIPELNSLQVNTALPDVDDGRIVNGLRATVTLDGYPSMSFGGRVTSISAVAQESARQSLRRSFKVIVALDKIDAERMRPGLSARVTIHSQALPTALVAPRAALDFSDNTARARLADGRMVEVKVGPCNAQTCVVTSGLEEGQRLSAVAGASDV